MGEWRGLTRANHCNPFQGMKLVLLLVSAALVSTVAASFSYTRTPFGHFLSSCVHEVPEGSHLSHNDDGTTMVTSMSGKVIDTIPACDTQNSTLPMRLPSAASAVQGTPLPPDYDGWLQYTAVNVSKLGLEGGFDAFTNVMSVPDVPEEEADQLFLFPGLQNIDWIPKVDPEPTRDNPFDILQPVLQYPGKLLSRTWELKSWYVTVNSGAIYSTGLEVQAGDAILCNMTRTGAEAWDVIGTLKSSGKATTQSATNSRLKLQPWAYNTLECYGCEGCKTYPKQPITFTDNKLYQNDKQVGVPGSAWAINPKPANALKCHEKTTVAANGDTTISFQ